jgi:hypothetical protein
MGLFTFSLNSQWGLNFKIISLYSMRSLAGILFGFFPRVSTVTFRISKFFGPMITDVTQVVEIRIWCIKIGIVWILHLNTSISDPKNPPMNDCFLTPCSHSHSLIRIVMTGLSVISMHFDCAVELFFTSEENMQIWLSTTEQVSFIPAVHLWPITPA